MGVGQSVIQGQGFSGRGLGFWKTTARGASIECREQLPRLGETSIRQCIVRIFRDSLIEVVDRSPQIFRSAFVPKESAFEIELMSFVVGRGSFGDPAFFRATQLRLQRVGNCFRNLALDREYVGQFSIEGIGPKMAVGNGVE